MGLFGRKRQTGRQKQIFLGHEDLARVRRFRNKGKLDRAEKILMRAEPSPAVLDELRKLASTRAREAKKAGDWQAVVQHLEEYNEYAEECRQHCIKTVNQEPPGHTKSDAKLLREAKAKLAS